MDNYQVWSRPEVVEEYARESHLQPPEEAILAQLVGKLHDFEMLDIGVGGGRTSIHFANACKRYVGTDISEEMVEACRRRFAGWPQSVRFVQADARDLRQFRDGEFDFVMFSFNGIDCIDPEGRLATFREIARVLKSHGVFVFSSHNVRGIPERMSLRRQLTWHPRNLLSGLKEWFNLNFVYNTPGKIKRAIAAPSCRIHDGVYQFAYETYHIKPDAQIEQLRPHFTVERVFDLSTKGSAIDSSEAMAATRSMWLYYLCRKTA